MRLRWLLPVLFVLVFALGTAKASATLLYAGGEDIDFLPAATCAGSCAVVTSAGTFRSGWAREGYSAKMSSSATDPPTQRFATPAFTASSQIWIHAQINSTAGGSATVANQQFLRVIGADGNPAILLRGTGTSAQIKISKRDTSGTITDLLTCPSSAFPTPNLDQLDIYINYATSGEVNIYRNSVSFCDYTGDVTTNGRTQVNAVEFAAIGGTTNDFVILSEVIIATTDTRAMARFTANTVANGNAMGFTGTNICSAIWNATSFNDANYGYSGSNNVLHECTINSSIPVGVYNVVALVMSARALVGSSGPLHFDFLTRTGGTDYASSDFAPTNSFSNITNYIQTVNPATSGPWGISDFQAAGFNVGEETKP
jgi:hypothetical protein